MLKVGRWLRVGVGTDGGKEKRKMGEKIEEMHNGYKISSKLQFLWFVSIFPNTFLLSFSFLLDKPVASKRRNLRPQKDGGRSGGMNRVP